MRRLALVALVLALAGEASAQMQHTTQRRSLYATQPTSWLDVPKANGGAWYGAPVPTFDCSGDAYTGGSLDCGNGYVFSKAGAPTPAIPTPFHPGGFQAAATVGEVGGFTNTAYLQTSGTDPMDSLPGDWSACAIFTPSASSNVVLWDDSNGSTLGYYVVQASPSTINFCRANGVCATASGLELGRKNMFCWGLSGGGTTGQTKLNLGLYATANTWATGPATGNQMRVGNYSNPAYAFSGAVHELWITSTTASDALFTAQQAKAFSRNRVAPLFDDDAGTAVHCYVNAGAWTCPVGPAWQTVGAPAYSTAPLALAGFHDPDASQAIRFNGATDEFVNSGAAGPTRESFTACVEYKVDGATSGGYSPIITKDSVGSITRTFAIGHIDATNTLTMFAFSNNGATSTQAVLSLGAPGSSTIGVWHVACGSYEYLGDGTSTMRGNFDGVATTAPNVLGVMDTAAPFALGTEAGGGRHLNGVLGRTTYWKGWAANASQLDAMVRTFWGMQPQRGGLTVTRAAVGACEQHGASIVHWFPAGVPCLNENGIKTHANSQNVLVNSSNPCLWTIRGTATCTSSSLLTPDGSGNAKRIHVATTANDIFQLAPITLGSGAGNSFWLKKVSASGTLVLGNPTDATHGNWSINLATLGSGWERITPTHPAVTITIPFQGAAGNGCGFHLFTNTGGGLDFDYFGGQQEPGVTDPTPYIPTGASTVSGPATVASTVEASPNQDAAGCARGDFTANFFNSAGRLIGWQDATSTTLYTLTATGLGLFMNGSSLGRTIAYPTFAARGAWDRGANVTALEVPGSLQVGSMPAGPLFVNRIFLGSEAGGGNFTNTAFGRIQLGRTFSGCRL